MVRSPSDIRAPDLVVPRFLSSLSRLVCIGSFINSGLTPALSHQSIYSGLGQQRSFLLCIVLLADVFDDPLRRPAGRGRLPAPFARRHCDGSIPGFVRNSSRCHRQALARLELHLSSCNLGGCRVVETWNYRSTLECTWLFAGGRPQ